MQKIVAGTFTLVTCGLLSGALSWAEEGMWTFDNPPTQQVKAAYGFSLTPEWLDRIRLSSVRFMDGGSGAFVSAEGLMITNHHVGLNCVQNLSRPGADYVAQGFYAPQRDFEPACPGYEVNILTRIEDVSGQVRGATTTRMDAAQARAARKAAMAQIENLCHQRTGGRCDVVTLYQGAEYHLYSYKTYTDVRLVFAPEEQAAFFGGDPDNFTFPRHDLDICLFRAYENGRPARPAAHLDWANEGAIDGELVFVSGHPGKTERLLTMAELETQRDQAVPSVIELFTARLAWLRAYAARGPEAARRALAATRSAENSLKAWQGRLAALQDAPAMRRKAEDERTLRTLTAADPALGPDFARAWEAVEQAQLKWRERHYEARYVTFAGARLLQLAGWIVQYVAETRKPNEVRLEEFVDASLPSLTNRLFSTAPLYPDLEEATLTCQLELALRRLGPNHAFVQAALAGRSPAEAAHHALAGTHLMDASARKALIEGGPAAVAASRDSLIVLARALDPLVRAVRRFQEDEIDAVVTRAAEQIAAARFKIRGKAFPPDATFTLRLGYGTVKGYPAEGTVTPARTTFYGLFDRAAAFGFRSPWSLPARFSERKERLDLATALNFVTTNDTVGGNSGSPVIDRAGRFVGIVFDGNIHSLAWDYFFTDGRGRTVAVDAAGILEALSKLYDANALVAELTASGS